LPCSLQNPQGADGIDFRTLDRIFDCAGNKDLSGQMEDDFTSAYRTGKNLLIPDITFNEGYLIRISRKVFPISGGKVVQDGNPTSF